MLQNLKKRTEGFTIIEVMIVLAIAGLILLIVFLAVPALQRNSRNTQRKNDVSSALGAVQEYANNHSGSLPTTAAQFTTFMKQGYYPLANVYLSINPASFTGTVSPPSTTLSNSVVTTENVVVITGYKCNTTVTAAPIKGAARSIAVVFAVEASTGNGTYQCQSS